MNALTLVPIRYDSDPGNCGGCVELLHMHWYLYIDKRTLITIH